MKNIQSDKRSQVPVDQFAPFAGYDGTTQPVMMNPALSPNVENVTFEDEIVRSRHGYGTLMAHWEIDSVTTGSKLFEVVGDKTAYVEVDQSIVVGDSTANDGTYTVASVTFADPNTEIVVDEAVSSSTADGYVTPIFKGNVVKVVEFTDLSGTRYLLALTTRRQYRWDGTNEVWIDISPRFTINTATLGGAGAGEFTINANETDELKAGQTFVVEGSTGNDGEYTLASVTWDDPLTDIVPDQAVDTGDDDGELVFEFTGDEDDMIEVVMGTDDNGTYIIISNNIDSPLYWSGSGDFSIAIAGQAITLSNFVTCKTMCELHGYMWMGNVQTGTTDIRSGLWSKNNDFFDFESGASGSNLFTDGEGELLRLVRLGDFMVAYFTRSVHLISHVGGSAIWKFDKHISGIGPISPRVIADVGPFHIFMGEEDFYLYDGTMLVRPIGEKNVAKPFRELFTPEYAKRAHAFVDPKQSHAYFVIPTGETTKKIYMLDYSLQNVNDFKWTVFDFNNDPMSFGWYSKHADLTWNGLKALRGDAYTWNVAAANPGYTWNDTQQRKDFPTKVFGSGAYVYTFDPSMGDDNGTAITSFRDSIAFTVPQEFQSVNGRWQEIEIDLRGTTCDIQYSTDQGKTWSFALQESDGSNTDGITITSDWETYRFLIDVISRTLMVRIKNPDAAGSFFARWLRVWVRPGEPS